MYLIPKTTTILPIVSTPKLQTITTNLALFLNKIVSVQLIAFVIVAPVKFPQILEDFTVSSLIINIVFCFVLFAAFQFKNIK